MLAVPRMLNNGGEGGVEGEGERREQRKDSKNPQYQDSPMTRRELLIRDILGIEAQRKLVILYLNSLHFPRELAEGGGKGRGKLQSNMAPAWMHSSCSHSRELLQTMTSRCECPARMVLWIALLSYLYLSAFVPV